MRGRLRHLVGTVGVLLAAAGCGSSDPVAVDPAVAPFVGTWDAVVMTVTADAPPNTVADVLALGKFWMHVEPSGQYQATLEWLGGFAVIGQLTVESTTGLTLHPNNGPPEPGSYTFATADSLILDGALQFDFNGDFIREPAQGHTELVRRP